MLRSISHSCWLPHTTVELHFKSYSLWYTPIIQTLRRLKQGDCCKFRASLSRIAELHNRTTSTNNNNNNNTHTCMHVWTHACTHTRMHAYTHARIHARTCAHSHTRQPSWKPQSLISWIAKKMWLTILLLRIGARAVVRRVGYAPSWLNFIRSTSEAGCQPLRTQVHARGSARGETTGQFARSRSLALSVAGLSSHLVPSLPVPSLPVPASSY